MSPLKPLPEAYDQHDLFFQCDQLNQRSQRFKELEPLKRREKMSPLKPLPEAYDQHDLFFQCNQWLNQRSQWFSG
jgi:hypothetical protein